MSAEGGHVVVAGLLVRAGQVLLAHRSPGRRWYPDVWDLPGGHVEPGESGGAALARELREELGLTVAAADCSPVATLRTGPDDDVAVELTVHRVQRWSGTPVNRCPEEHDELRWCTAADLSALPLVHPAYGPLLIRALDEEGQDIEGEGTVGDGPDLGQGVR